MKLYTAEAVGRLLNLTARRVRQLRDEGVLIEARTGLYPLVDSVHRYIDYLKHGVAAGGTVDYRTEQALLLRAKRQNEEYDLGVKERELHQAEEIRQFLTAMLVTFRARLRGIPTKAAPVVAHKNDAAEIAEYLAKEIDAALMELTDYDTLFRGVMDERSDA